MALRLRQMQIGSDLPRVAHWLDAPHVARWWLVGSSAEGELEDIREGVIGVQAMHLLVVAVDDEPVGWCQWYLCEAHPARRPTFTRSWVMSESTTPSER